MPVTRREFLKIAGVGLGAAVMAPVPAEVHAAPALAEDTHSMLYDASLCVGCRACSNACKRRSNLPPEFDSNHLYDMPADLSADTWTIIKLYKGNEGLSFVKDQCMHCIEPACVSVCPVAALEKTKAGPVVYHADRCIGCRYCMAACPFGIPKARWRDPLPLIQKCDFCADRQAQGLQPACGEVCPTGALISGTRGKMLDIAHQRLDQEKAYFQHVYGESEAGGTSMLYISRIDFEKLGFPALDDRSLPDITWPYMEAVPWVVATVATLSTAIYFYTHRRSQVQANNGKKPVKEK
jgi:formate dehydrogenase iron-sulfur subunit